MHIHTKKFLNPHFVASNKRKSQDLVFLEKVQKQEKVILTKS